MTYLLLLYLPLLSSILLFSIAVYSWRYRNIPIAIPHSILMILLGLWSLLIGISFHYFKVEERLLLNQCINSIVPFVPVVWIVVVARHLRQDYLLNRRFIIGLCIVPLLTVTIVWCFPLTLFYRLPLSVHLLGPIPLFFYAKAIWYWVYLGYSYTLIACSLIWLVQSLRDEQPLFRHQSVVMILSSLLPWIADIYFNTRISPFRGMNLAPSVFLFTGALSYWSLFRYRLLDLVPVARGRVVEMMSDSMLVLDTKDRLVDYNTMARSILGSNAASSIGHPIEKLSHPWSEILLRFQNTLEVREEVEVATGDIPVVFDLSIAPIRDEHGHLLGRMVLLHDISELACYRSQLESLVEERTIALQLTNEQLRQEIAERQRVEIELRRHADIIKQVDDAIIATDLRLFITSWNSAAERIYGWTVDEMLGRCSSLSLQTEYQGITPDEVFAQVLQSGSFQGEVVQRCKDGSSLPIELTIAPFFDLHGEPQGYISVNRDISERKRTEIALYEREAQFRALAENTGCVILRINRAQEIVYLNPTAAALFQCDPTEIVGKALHDLSSNRAYLAVLERHIPDVFSSGQPYDGQHTIAETIYELRLYPEYDSTGQVMSVIHFSVDVSERIHAEARLERSQLRLRSLAARLQSVREEERARMARNIHDDLGHVLAALRMDLSWVEKHLKAADTKMSVAKMKERLVSMIQMTDETIRQVRETAASLRPGILDDMGLVAALEWETRRFTQRTGIACQFDCQFENISLENEAATALFRVSQELMTNALQHANATNIVMSLAVDTATLLLRIQDNGRGIRPEEINAPMSIGLFGIRERIATLQGEFNIHGKDGGGTLAVIRIPYKPRRPKM